MSSTARYSSSSCQLAAAVSQHAQELHIVVLEERQHTVIEQIGRRDRRLAARIICDVSPWSRRAVDICQLDTYRPDTCQSGPCRPEAPEEAAPCAADRRRRQRSAWPRMQPLRLEFSASSILSCLCRVSGKAVNAAPVRRPADLCTSNLPELRC